MRLLFQIPTIVVRNFQYPAFFPAALGHVQPEVMTCQSTCSAGSAQASHNSSPVSIRLFTHTLETTFPPRPFVPIHCSIFLSSRAHTHRQKNSLRMIHGQSLFI